MEFLRLNGQAVTQATQATEPVRNDAPIAPVDNKTNQVASTALTTSEQQPAKGLFGKFFAILKDLYNSFIKRVSECFACCVKPKKEEPKQLTQQPLPSNVAAVIPSTEQSVATTQPTEQPKAEEKSATESTIVPAEQPKVEEKTATEGTPVPTEQPKVEDTTVPTEQPKVEEKTATEGTPVPTEQPKVEEKTAPEGTPVLTEQPKVEEKTVIEGTPVPTEQPKVEDTTVPTQLTVATDATPAKGTIETLLNKVGFGNKN